MGTLVLKLMRKHGWPAILLLGDQGSPYGSFTINHDILGPDGPDDFTQAISIAVRIVAAQLRVRVSEWRGAVEFDALYEVTPSGVFKELSPLRITSNGSQDK